VHLKRIRKEVAVAQFKIPSRHLLEKVRKITWITRISRFLAETWTRDLPARKCQCQPFSHDLIRWAVKYLGRNLNMAVIGIKLFVEGLTVVRHISLHRTATNTGSSSSSTDSGGGSTRYNCGCFVLPLNWNVAFLSRRARGRIFECQYAFTLTKSTDLLSSRQCRS
jgi:hypothetical protein